MTIIYLFTAAIIFLGGVVIGVLVMMWQDGLVRKEVSEIAKRNEREVDAKRRIERIEEQLLLEELFELGKRMEEQLPAAA